MTNKYLNYSNQLKKYKLFISSMKDKYINIPNLDTNYIPQGFCLIDDYTLITAYDYTKQNNSVIYIINKHNKLIKTVLLEDKYHVGGISYHKKSNSIYITGKSGTSNGVSSYINKYNFDDLLNKTNIQATSKFQVDNNNTLKSAITNKSSVAYLTIYNNDLYLGNFTIKNKGKIKKYNLDNNGDIISDSCITLDNPYKKTQGLCIYKKNNEYYYIFSTSLSRFKDSTIYISKLTNNNFNLVKKIKLPVMSEQINITESNELSILFESGSIVFKYAKNKISDICFIDLNNII